jgi:hypothetical protein
MPDANPGPTVSSAKLDALLNQESPESSAIRLRFHRTMLWRLRTGKRSPDLETASLLQSLSGGKIAAVGWTQHVAQAPVAKSKRARAGGE